MGNRNNIHVICPHCGLEVEIGDDNVKATSLKDIPAGVYALMPKNDKRIQALKDLGFDLSGLFGGSGSGNSGSSNDSYASGEDDDEIVTSIREEGDVEGKGLWRRWVMGQMFRALNGKGYDKYYSELPYEYSWKTLLDELYAQTKIKDPKELEIRQRFFNKETVNGMLLHYAKALKALPRKLGTKNCKGLPYVHIPYSGMFFVNDVRAEADRADHVRCFDLAGAESVAEVYQVVKTFMGKMIRLPKNTRKAQAWRNSFMGAGSYYTLDNMIRFHGCRIYSSAYTRIVNDTVEDGQPYSKQQSLEVLDELSRRYKCDLYKLFALMRATIESNEYEYDNDASIRREGLKKAS